MSAVVADSEYSSSLLLNKGYRGQKDDARIHFDLEQYKISYWSRTSRGQFRWSKGMKPVERLPSIVPSRKTER